MINLEWDYDTVVDNIKTLKDNYLFSLASFNFNIKARIEYIKYVKNQIYSLKFDEFRRDKIWEYLNDYETLDMLIFLTKRETDKRRNEKLGIKGTQLDIYYFL